MERSALILSAAALSSILVSGQTGAQAASFRPTVSGAIERTLDPSSFIHDESGASGAKIMLVRGSGSKSSGGGGSFFRSTPSVPPVRATPAPSYGGSSPAPNRTPPVVTPRVDPAPAVRAPSVSSSSRAPDARNFNVGGNTYTGLAAAQAALAAFVPESAINALAVGQYSGMLQTSPVVGPDKVLHHEIHNVVKWLLDHNPQIDSRGWEVHVINDPNIVNAWCMPGMKMAVYTKLIERMDNDVGLVAAVMAHEIAHAELKHGYRQVRERLLLSAAHTYVMGKTNSLAGSLAVALGGNAIKALTMADASRDHEDEADERALHILKNAGYDPRLMIRALQKLARPNAKTEAGLLDSHPAIAERVARLERIIAQM